jgi:uncharacterized protein (DUF362 family)
MSAEVNQVYAPALLVLDGIAAFVDGAAGRADSCRPSLS